MAHHPALEYSEFENAFPGNPQLALNAAIQACQREQASALTFEPKDYFLDPAFAPQGWRAISNHDSGYHHVSAPLSGFRDFRTEGNGARFHYRDAVIPFALDNCESVSLKDFTIDWTHSLHLQAILLDADTERNRLTFRMEDTGLVLADFGGSVRYLDRTALKGRVLERGNHFFPRSGEVFWSQPIDWMVWQDPATGAIARDSASAILRHYDATTNRQSTMRLLDEQHFEIEGAFYNAPPQPGWRMIDKGLRYTNRCSPAIHIHGGQDIGLADITIHHCGGMGVIGELAENISLENVQVVPEKDSPRTISATADAAHFVSCSGHIELSGCHFAQMLDDGLNVHGNYLRVAGEAGGKLILERAHPQHAGFAFAAPGDHIPFSRADTLEVVGEAVASRIQSLNARFLELTVEDASVFGHAAHPLVAHNLSREPDVTVQNCHVERNRGRGILATTSGTIRIENNHFEKNAMPGILVEGDAFFWHESGTVQNMHISGNTFEDYSLEFPDSHLLVLSPKLESMQRSAPMHRGIVFERNRVLSSNGLLVDARSIGDLSVCQNEIELLGELKELPPDAVRTIDCPNFSFQENPVKQLSLAIG